MSLTLHNIQPKKGSKKTKKRIGRGLGSKGRYSGRGLKGQRARAGGKSGLKLKGLRQVMLATPKKRGFKSQKPKPEAINLGVIARFFPNDAKITPQVLIKKGLVEKSPGGVKILGRGDLTIKLTVSDCYLTRGAKQKIEAAGGTVVEKTK